MHFFDIVSLASFGITLLTFLLGYIKPLKRFHRELLGAALFLGGFLISRLVYDYLPPSRTMLAFRKRDLIWIIVIGILSSIVLVALKREGSQAAIWVVFMGFMLLTFYGKTVGLYSEFSLRDDELLTVVDSKDRAGDYDRAIQILKQMQSGKPTSERDAIAKRIGLLGTPAHLVGTGTRDSAVGEAGRDRLAGSL